MSKTDVPYIFWTAFNLYMKTFLSVYNKTVKLQTNLRKVKMAKYHLKTWFLLCNQEKLQIFSKLS